MFTGGRRRRKDVSLVILEYGRLAAKLEPNNPEGVEGWGRRGVGVGGHQIGVGCGSHEDGGVQLVLVQEDGEVSDLLDHLRLVQLKVGSVGFPSSV